MEANKKETPSNKGKKSKRSGTALKVAGGVLVGAAAGALAGVFMVPRAKKHA